MEAYITAGELLLRLGDDEVLVLDCRPPEDGTLSELYIPGALRVPVHELANCVHSLPADELIVVYDASPDGALSQRAWRLLVGGNRHAVLLSGGLRGWVAEGYPTERMAQPPSMSSAEP